MAAVFAPLCGCVLWCFLCAALSQVCVYKNLIVFMNIMHVYKCTATVFASLCGCASCNLVISVNDWCFL